MKKQLESYVNLLFAGAADAGDIHQEILQNTLDRYDDLIAQGKTPQAAYSLAIAGIGDVSELLGGGKQQQSPSSPVHATPTTPTKKGKPLWKKITTAVAISLYMLCAIPLIILAEMDMEVIGLCATLSIVAVATVAIVIASDDEKSEKAENAQEKPSTPQNPRQKLSKAVSNAISVAGLCVYFIISFWTGAWYITWLIFPMMGAVQGLVNAIFDLKEAKKNEN